MANFLRLPSGRIANLDLFADIDPYLGADAPWVRVTLPAAGGVGSPGDGAIFPATIDYNGDDARALMAHFDQQEVVRVAPLVEPDAPGTVRFDDPAIDAASHRARQAAGDDTPT